ncbi:hypothetical protein PMNALOAF_3769 [Methylobacterium adhaesivum]|nr:hypothetical protein PMNALOAF_3769 [Methylobacterium adhaesivum]
MPKVKLVLTPVPTFTVSDVPARGEAEPLPRPAAKVVLALKPSLATLAVAVEPLPRVTAVLESAAVKLNFRFVASNVADTVPLVAMVTFWASEVTVSVAAMLTDWPFTVKLSPAVKPRAVASEVGSGLNTPAVTVAPPAAKPRVLLAEPAAVKVPEPSSAPLSLIAPAVPPSLPAFTAVTPVTEVCALMAAIASATVAVAPMEIAVPFTVRVWAVEATPFEAVLRVVLLNTAASVAL